MADKTIKRSTKAALGTLAEENEAAVDVKLNKQLSSS